MVNFHEIKNIYYKENQPVRESENHKHTPEKKKFKKVILFLK